MLAALVRADVRFVVVGGVAVVLQGYPRLTADLDLAIDLDEAPLRRALDALEELGLVPLLPVSSRDFADPVQRAQWVDERDLRVFTMHDRADPLRQVDLFAEDPIPFEDLWSRAMVVDLDGVSIRVASVDDLITMETMAGRPRDLEDIQALLVIREQGDG